MSVFPLARRTNAIEDPSGDQLGSAARLMSRWAAPPAESTIQICGPCEVTRVNAIEEPSGSQLGSASFAGPEVICTSSPPVEGTVQRSPSRM